MVSVLQILGEIIVYSLKRVQMEFELKKNEQKYRRLFQNSMIAIYTTTPEGKIIDFNNHLSNLLGYTQQELNSMTMYDLLYDEKDLNHLIETLNEINLMDNVEIKFKHKDGTTIHTLTTMRLIQEDGHSIIHGITKDITELRETTEKLYKSEKLKSLGIMAGGIAHDFNNLLTSIRGYTELSESLVHDTELKNYLDNIKQNTTRAIRLTSKLLSYAGEGIFITETTNLAQKVLEERNYYQNTIQKNKLRFEIKDTDYVDIDYSVIDQVIMNFLYNASEVTEVHDEIVLTTGKTDAKTIQSTNYDLMLNSDPVDGEYAFLAVQDNGTGIASENLESIFEPYFTTKFQGRGLGLSASWGIVKNHNGIVAVNTSTEGTTMTVFIPLSPHNTETSVEKLEIKEVDKNILIVDDEPSVRDITTKILENMNYNTIALPNGEDILKVLAKLSIDLIIIDQTMPGKTGIEIISEIRAQRIEIPVILTSGYSADDYMDKLEQLEIIQFLHKPYSVDELKTVVTKTIQP